MATWTRGQFSIPAGQTRTVFQRADGTSGSVSWLSFSAKTWDEEMARGLVWQATYDGVRTVYLEDASRSSDPEAWYGPSLTDFEIRQGALRVGGAGSPSR